jgi:hypothetical protein
MERQQRHLGSAKLTRVQMKPDQSQHRLGEFLTSIGEKRA